MRSIWKILIMSLLMPFGCSVFGQQIPIFSLYNENGYVVNPAMTGSEGHGIFSATYRHQWTKIENAPRTISGGYRMPIYQKGDMFQRADNFIGVGGYILHDKTGPTSYLQGSLMFAYHISFAKINPFSWARFLRKSHISIGISGSVYQYRLNTTELLAVESNDPLVISADDGKVLPNVGAGIYYYYDKFYLGYSAPQLIPLKVKFKDEDDVSPIKRINHHYIVVGGSIPLGGRVPRGQVNKFYIEPAAWFKYVKGAPYQFDIYSRFRFKDIVWFGVGYRSSMAMVIDAGVMIKSAFKVGYAYDLYFGENQSYFGGTHEIVLSYHINRDKRKY